MMKSTALTVGLVAVLVYVGFYELHKVTTAHGKVRWLALVLTYVRVCVGVCCR
jgi:hypothetical protein